MSDSDLLRQIADLAGAINRHKADEQRLANPSAPYRPLNYRGRMPYRGYRGRGASSYRAKPMVTHRNRTLVLNGPAVGSHAEESTAESVSDTGESGSRFVRKTDRHMQLINSNVYSDLTLARNKAIETTRLLKEKKRRQKRALRAEREANQARQMAQLEEVEIDGVKYAVRKGGSKLIRVTGKCARGLSCPYNHDPSHVALCQLYLHNKCQNPACDLSHTPTAHNSPLCLHFQRGNCSNPNCKYTHMSVPAGAKICRDFALKGYCDAGDKCDKRHVFECPDFEETGKCPRGESKCRLMHVFRAGRNKEVDSDGLVFTDDNGDVRRTEVPSDIFEDVKAHLEEESARLRQASSMISPESDGSEDEEEDEDDDLAGEDVEFDSDMFEDDDEPDETASVDADPDYIRF